MIAVLAFAGLADLLTFACASAVLPISGELNPIARHLYVEHGLLAVAWGKSVVTSIAVALAFLLPPFQKGVACGFGATFLTFGAVMNTVSVVVSA